jgi:hypothetical protein
VPGGRAACLVAWLPGPGAGGCVPVAAWSVVRGPWSVVPAGGRAWSLPVAVPGPCRWPWCLAPGPWTWWPWSLDLAPRPMIRGPWRHSEYPHPRPPKTGPGPGGAGFSPFLHGMFHVKHFLTPCSNKGPPLSNKSTCVKICAIPKRNGP